MDIRQLKHFKAVAELGNFTKAAKAMNIAQPALSISIKKFEQQLGLSLFNRRERVVSLTDEGKALMQHASRILQAVEDATIEMAELKGLEKGEVRLGVPSMMGSYFFPPVLMAFKSKYPQLKIYLVEAGTQSIRRMLESGDLDLGVILNRDGPESLTTEPLIRSQMVAVVGEHHSLSHLDKIDYQTFFKQELVMFKPEYFHREFIDHLCEERNLSPIYSFETNLMPMILNIVKNEFAITALLEIVSDAEHDVKGIPFAEPVYLDLALASRKEGYLSKANQTFIEFVRRNISQRD